MSLTMKVSGLCGVKGWSEGSIVQENGLFNDNKINKTYQNYIVGEKQDGWGYN